MTPKTKSARRNFRLLAILLSGSALAGGTLAAYADSTWTGATSTDWHDASNWSPAALPTSTDNVVIDLMANPTVAAGGTVAADELDIGVHNSGSLTLSSGGALTSNGDTILGINAGSIGSLTVSSGATFTVAGVNQLDIGELGSGTVLVQGASTLTAGRIEIGGAGGGTATVDASAISATNLDIGVGGTGNLTVQNAAQLNTTDTTINTNGTLTVKGANSVWIGTGNLLIGNGTLNVLAGAETVISSNVTIGDAGHSGTVMVDGQSAQFGALATTNVGFGGTGTVSVTNGGLFVSHNINLGIGTAASTGTVTVDSGGVFNSSGAVNVGVDGTGTVIYENSSDGSVDALDIGVNAGSHGAVTISNNPSNVFVNHAVTVGNAGTGILTINNEGYFQGDSLTIGSANGSNGTVTVDGSLPAGLYSTLIISNDIAVGNANGSAGTLTVSGGAFASGNFIELGVFSGATGTVTVTGSASELQSFSNIFVGEGGTGTLNILAGATVSDGFIAYVGQAQGATGTINVDGAGSILTTAANLLVGGDIVDPTGGTGFVNVTNGGVITDSSSLNLGASSGATGTLTIDGAGSSVTAVSSIIGDTGNGQLIVRNGGALTTSFLAVGSTTGSTGTMVVSGAGTTVTDSGALEVGDNGTGTLTLSGGTVSAASVALSSGAGGVGTLNVGAAPGSTATAPGTLNAPTLAFGSNTGTLNFNHTSTAYTFAPVISGAGTINQIAGVTFLSADNSGFMGATNIIGGALHVNGSLKNSAVAVSGGGTLAGNSLVGAVTVASGGIVAPGNSIGTLTVNGNYSAASGSIYNAEVDSAGHSDLLKVTGTASIASGAVLNITKIDATAYVGGTKYTLLTAAGGVNGTYTVTGDVINSGFISSSVVYDANDVYLNVVQKASFSSVALTPNQKTVAAVVDALPGNSSLLTAMFTLPDGASARIALDKLSGEIHASARTALVEDSRFVREAALDRLAAPNVDHPVVWGQGFGDWGSNDGNGNAAGMNRSTKGFIGGVDLPVHQTWRVGVLGGFSNTSLNVQDRSSSGTSNNYHLGIYGGTEAGPVAVRVGATYSWSDLQTARAVAFGSLSDQPTAQYNGGTTQGFGEVGYKLDMGRVSLEPFANLAYVSLHTAAFKEAGGVSALSVSGDTTSTTFTTLGLHAREQVDLGISTIFTARGSLGWRHAFGDITPVSANAFAGGTTFNIDGVPVAQNAMAVDAGFDAAVSEHLTLGLSYTGQYASSARDNGVKANVGWRF